MPFTFTSVQADEHHNGAFLGSFYASGNEHSRYSYYFGELDWLNFEGNNLYLADNWHFDFERDEVVKYNEFFSVDASPGVEYHPLLELIILKILSNPFGYRTYKTNRPYTGEFLVGFIDLKFIDVEEKFRRIQLNSGYTLGAEIVRLTQIQEVQITLNLITLFSKFTKIKLSLKTNTSMIQQEK